MLALLLSREGPIRVGGRESEDRGGRRDRAENPANIWLVGLSAGWVDTDTPNKHSAEEMRVGG